MPTGYTAGIIDGKITNFDQIARNCMRAFGATVHMREDDMDAEYTPRVPSQYHAKSIQEYKDKLESIKRMSDEEIIKNKIKALEDSRDYALKSIETATKSKARLEKILVEVNKFIPPTSEHVNFKDFMVQQITNTIQWDCSGEYATKTLGTYADDIANIDVEEERTYMIEDANKSIKYHEKKWKEEVDQRDGRRELAGYSARRPRGHQGWVGHGGGGQTPGSGGGGGATRGVWRRRQRRRAAAAVKKPRYL